MMTHFYAAFNKYNNRLIDLDEINETEIEKARQIEQRRREEERQERIRQEQERAEKARREAEEKQRQEHLNNLKEAYSSCRFLFEAVDKNYTSDEDFVSCITQKKQEDIDNEIMLLIHNKMNELSEVFIKGTEFKDQSLYRFRIGMERICAIPNRIRNTSPTIAQYTETQIEDFVVNRKKLKKAYDKAQKKEPYIKYSEFMISYINENKQ
jgi:membrane-associated HD superfamily phosphohydrolase